MQDFDDVKKPEVDTYYIRPKLANLRMKTAQDICQTVYICGSVGYGKTSLVADFLSKKYYEYYGYCDPLRGWPKSDIQYPLAIMNIPPWSIPDRKRCLFHPQKKRNVSL